RDARATAQAGSLQHNDVPPIASKKRHSRPSEGSGIMVEFQRGGGPRQGSRAAPYCSNCGYMLTGLTESSKCPECGRPLVEVLTRPAFGNPAVRSKRYQSNAKLFGWPVISIAYGPYRQERIGHARGVIAMGDIATGGIACGGVARGIVAVGGVAVGVCAIGG